MGKYKDEEEDDLVKKAFGGAKMFMPGQKALKGSERVGTSQGVLGGDPYEEDDKTKKKKR